MRPSLGVKSLSDMRVAPSMLRQHDLDRSQDVSRWRQKQHAIPAPYPSLDVCAWMHGVNKHQYNQSVTAQAARVFYLDVPYPCYLSARTVTQTHDTDGQCSPPRNPETTLAKGIDGRKASMRRARAESPRQMHRTFEMTVAQTQHDSDGADADGWAGGWESRVARHAGKETRERPPRPQARGPERGAQSCGFQIRA